MKYYDINLNKKEQALKQHVKQNMKNANGFVKFCYILTWILKALSVVLGAVNILYVLAMSHDGLELVMLIITFGFPMLLSLLPATVYIISAGGEHRFRKEETVVFKEDYFIYSHKDSRTGLTNELFCNKVKYSEISDLLFDEKTKVIEVHGKILVETYMDSELKDTIEAKIFDFIDAYDVSIVELLRERIDNLK